MIARASVAELEARTRLLMVGEASSAASTNRYVSRYLIQAGVPNTWVDLGTVGIHGNGHMMMLEKNELEIVPNHCCFACESLGKLWAAALFWPESVPAALAAASRDKVGR
jgi:hypothetical protein